MKTELEHIQPKEGSSISLSVNPDFSDFFYWHFHPEFELVFIDGVDISRLELSVLRSKISVIPQQPVIFSGSLRYNLGAFGGGTHARAGSLNCSASLCCYVDMFLFFTLLFQTFLHPASRTRTRGPKREHRRCQCDPGTFWDIGASTP